MSTSVETIASSLPTMSVQELTQIQKLTEMLIGGEQKQTQADDPVERLLFEAVKAELQAAGHNYKISYSTIIDSRYSKGWQRGVTVTKNFVESSFGKHAKTEAQRYGIYRILIQALISDFGRLGIPVSIGTIANNLHRVPQAFDRQFPGYLKSGLAYLVPMAMRHQKTK